MAALPPSIPSPMATTLVLCRSPAGLPALRRVRSKRPLVVASDDPRVLAAARALPGVRSVCFIEQMESFYHASDEVIRLLAGIDAGLASLDPSLPPDVLSWGRNVEGGIMNQRVQDAVLLVRSYFRLFAASAATEVQVIRDPRHLWEDQVLFACARERALPCRTRSLQWVACQVRALATRLRPWAVAAYHLVSLVRAGALRLRRPPAPSSLDGAVIFQTHSSLPKHVENIRPLMHALVARGVRPVALCWEAAERRAAAPASAVLAAQGLTVIRLEDFLTAGDLGRSVTVSLRAAWRSRRRPEPWRRLQTGGVPLYPLLAPSLAHFFTAELPQRLRYDRALAVVLPPARPVALKLAGGPESFEGKAALRLLARRADTLVFHYWVGTAPEWPYADGQHKIDLFFAKGPAETRHAVHDYALAPAQIVLTGQARFARTAESAAAPTPAFSRQLLGLPLDGQRYIGFDPNGALRGCLTVREQTDMTTALLQAAHRHPRFILVVKPHPSYPIDHLAPLLAEAALPNVHVLSRRAPVAHFINAVDLIVTKYSTLMLEAALAARAPVSALFDGEDRFKIYGDLPEIVRSPGELESLLERLSDDAVFPAWREAQLERHRRLLPQYYHQTDRLPAEIAADALCERLK